MNVERDWATAREAAVEIRRLAGTSRSASPGELDALTELIIEQMDDLAKALGVTLTLGLGVMEGKRLRR